jgi:hypothetical protein
VKGMDCDDAVAYVKDEIDAYPEQKACIKPESIHVIDCDAAVTSEYKRTSISRSMCVQCRTFALSAVELTSLIERCATVHLP